MFSRKFFLLALLVLVTVALFELSASPAVADDPAPPDRIDLIARHADARAH